MQCDTGRVRSTTLLRPLFTIFLFQSWLWSKVMVSVMVPTPFVSAQPARENEGMELRVISMSLSLPTLPYKILYVVMTQVGGLQMQRGRWKALLDLAGTPRSNNVTAKLQSLAGKTAAGKRRRIWKLKAVTGERLWLCITGQWGRTFRDEKSSQLKLPNRIDLNVYIVGAGACIPYKREIDDVGWLCGKRQRHT